MELDHQQMAGASFGKPITAAVPGLRGDSSEVTAWGFTCSKAPSFWFLYLVFLIYFQLPAHLQSCATEQHMLLLSPGGEERALELQAMAPWELATLGTPRLRKCLCHCNTCEKSTEASSNSLQNEGSLLRPAFNKQMKGEAIYCRAWGSCNRINSLWVLALR